MEAFPSETPRRQCQCSPSCTRILKFRYFAVLLIICCAQICATKYVPSYPTTQRKVIWHKEPFKRRTHGTFRPKWCEIRGGSDAIEERAEPEEEKQPQISSKQSRSWLGIFRLRNEVQAAASEEPFAKTSTTTTTNSRGGAVVKPKPPKRGFSWRFPTERFRPAPQQTIQSVRRVWWVSAWAEQLPTEEEEQSAIELEAELEARTALEGVNTETKEETSSTLEIEEREILNATSSKGQSIQSNQTQPKEATRPRNRWRGRSPNENVESSDPEEKSAESTGSGSAMPVDAATETSSEHDSGKHDNPTRIAIPGAMGTMSQYTSSGYWSAIDQLCSFGFANSNPSLRLSNHLRPVRKLAARATGLHGWVSGKPKLAKLNGNDSHQVRHRANAIKRAKQVLEAPPVSSAKFWKRTPNGKMLNYNFVLQQTLQDEIDENSRRKRVKTIDEEMEKAQKRLAELACEKDVLQQRPNPFWKYAATKPQANSDSGALPSSSRFFNFPSEDLVIEYLDTLFASGRLIRLNHTDLWRNANNDEPEEIDDDDFLAPSPYVTDDKRRPEDGGSGGSWLLRNGLGEKIGITTERAAYKAVCKSLMSVLARSLSSLHGVTVMKHSDIRVTMEAQSLPPLAPHIPGSEMNRNYAQETIKDVMRRGARANRFRRPKDDFIQRAAVVETLLSQCQIAAPIMKLFPLAWQRAMLGNIISMVTALIADFCEGIEFQILGHRLAISFTPITEEDMIRSIHASSFNSRQPKDKEKFEAAVRETAEDVGEGLKFLDRWHERALGGGVLRTQIATLIARLVLTLVDDILIAAKMDLWTTQAGGPRLVSGLEYRSFPTAARTQ